MIADYMSSVQPVFISVTIDDQQVYLSDMKQSNRV